MTSRKLADKLAEQEAGVLKFIEERRSILEDPDAKLPVLYRVYEQGDAMLWTLSDLHHEFMEPIDRAADGLQKATSSNAELKHCVQLVESAESEYLPYAQRVLTTLGLMQDFLAKVEIRMKYG